MFDWRLFVNYRVKFIMKMQIIHFKFYSLHVLTPL